ncbi:signal peptide peptidase SppA [Candidatus Micrarchaeota archaeon]|nr:signal peptide peptidase SppA [Candidatus Micrarchaeota archaeon]
MKTDKLVVTILLVAIGALMVAGTIVAVYAIYYLATPTECVGVIQVNGEISTQTSSGGLFGTPTIGSDDIVNQINNAENNGNVKAVVFEVNSPGGSVVASREIYEAVRDIKKPKVAYFREVAASGAYYISAPTDYIVSEPDALTGSIGVTTTFEDMSGLFNKLGLNYTIFKSGELKDMGTNTRPPTEKEKQIMQTMINQIFDEFKTVVEEGRKGKLNEQKFNEILDARVLTGRQAKEVGLVDEIGNKKLALTTAANLANMSYKNQPVVCEMGSTNPFGGILSSLGQGITYAMRDFLSLSNSAGVKVSYT